MAAPVPHCPSVGRTGSVSTSVCSHKPRGCLFWCSGVTQNRSQLQHFTPLLLSHSNAAHPQDVDCVIELCVEEEEKGQIWLKCPERGVGVHLLPQTHSKNWLCGIRKQNQDRLLQVLEKALFWLRPGTLCRIIAGNYFPGCFALWHRQSSSY